MIRQALYCVTVERESEEMWIGHMDFYGEPSRDEVLAWVMEQELNYDDDYGRINYWLVGG